MRLLGIECATENCSVALFEQGVLLAGTAQVLGRGHAEALIPMIAALPGKGMAQRITVSLGPGSFTGLRVGLAAARALALAWKAPLTGYPTHALIAAMARAQVGDQPVSVAMNGGHGEWFLSEFGADGAMLTLPLSLSPAEAAAEAQAAVVAGSQAAALVEARGTGQALPILPDARQLLLLDPALFSPVVQLQYGRAPDARLPGGILHEAPR
jgi:tRNA threonylcarbamoyl adenosine modification protein YeaZ